MVSVKQGVFMPSKSIAKNVLVGQGVMHSLLQASRRKSLMDAKIDMENIYDRLHRAFLDL